MGKKSFITLGSGRPGTILAEIGSHIQVQKALDLIEETQL
jgi:hypothetical protein